jgi:hypothetical protein
MRTKFKIILKKFLTAPHENSRREVPEAMKPRRIAISGSVASNIREIETKAA